MRNHFLSTLNMHFTNQTQNLVNQRSTFVNLLRTWNLDGEPIKSFIKHYQPNTLHISAQFYTDSSAIEKSRIAILITRVADAAEGSCILCNQPEISSSYLAEALALFFIEIASVDLKNFHSFGGVPPGQAVERLTKLNPIYGSIERFGSLTDSVAFFLSDDVVEKLDASDDIVAPSGFYFDRLSLSDLDVVVACFPHSSTYRDRTWFERLIKNLPTCCLRTQGDQKLVAFEMLQSTLMLHHLYVMPEYRKKGFGQMLEQRFLQSLIKCEYGCRVIAHKRVVANNDTGKGFTYSRSQAQLWTPQTHHRVALMYQPLK